MLAAWLWTIPSILSVGVFAVIVSNALFDRSAAERSGDHRMKVVATERALTALGLWAMGLLSSVVGVLAVALPNSKVAGALALWVLIVVPWAHLLIGLNIIVGRKKAGQVPPRGG